MKAAMRVIYSFDSFTVDVDEGRLWLGDQPVSLTPKAFDTLLVLLENNGNLVNKDTLLDEVWKDTFVEESTLAQNISTLRKALGTGLDGRQFIETIPRRGYRFNGDVRKIVGEDEVVVVRRSVRTSISTERVESPEASIDIRAGDLVDYRFFQSNAVKFAVFLLLAIFVVVGVYAAFRYARPTKMSASAFSNISVKKLTSDGDIAIVRVTPDGKFIAMVERRNGLYSLLLRQVDNSTSIEVLPAAERRIAGLAFAPDGKDIFYTSYEEKPAPGQPQVGKLFRVSTLGGPAKLIASDVDSSIAISPDGHNFAFVRNYPADGHSSVIIRSFGDETERELASESLRYAFSTTGLSWSPDGKSIAAVRQMDDGRMAAVSIGVDDGKQTVLTSGIWQWIGFPAWLADGSGILVAAYSNASHTQTDEIWEVPFPEGEPRRISDGTNGIMGLSLTSDSKSVVAVRSQLVSGFWAGNADDPAKAVRIKSNLPDHNFGFPGAFWTRDGRVVFGSSLNGNADIWVMDADGTHLKQLTSDPSVDSQPVISSDGAYIFFVSNRSGNRSLWRMRSDGSEQVQFADDAGVSSPSISSNGAEIFFSAFDTKSRLPLLRKIPLAGGQSAQISSSATLLPAVSPDGKYIACYSPSSKAASPTAADLRLTLLAADTGQVWKQFTTNLPEKLSPIIWIDNENFAYSTSTSEGSRLWKQPVGKDEAAVMLDSQGENILRFAWSPDGSKVFYEKGTAINDVVLISSVE